MQQLIYRAWLKRESLLRDNRSHAPDEVRSKCLDLSSICIAGEQTIASNVKLINWVRAFKSTVPG